MKQLTQAVPPVIPGPLSSEFGTYKAVKARFWPWLYVDKVRRAFQVVPSSLGRGGVGIILFITLTCEPCMV